MTELDSTRITNCGASYKDKVVYLNKIMNGKIQTFFNLVLGRPTGHK